jgi:hypothetical protein
MNIKMTIPDVQNMFEERYYASRETEHAFGFRPNDDPLPEYWTPKDYELHAKAGHALICYPNQTSIVRPITLEEMASRYAVAARSFLKDLLYLGQFELDGIYSLLGSIPRSSAAEYDTIRA